MEQLRAKPTFILASCCLLAGERSTSAVQTTIPRLAFTDGERIGLVLRNGDGKLVTEEDYKKEDGHKDVRSFELDNRDAFDAMQKECGYGKGKEGGKNFHRALINSSCVMQFKLVRYDSEGVLGSTKELGPTNRRRVSAKYKYTITDESEIEYFAPFEDLDIQEYRNRIGRDKKLAAVETNGDKKPPAKSRNSGAAKKKKSSSATNESGAAKKKRRMEQNAIPLPPRHDVVELGTIPLPSIDEGGGYEEV